MGRSLSSCFKIMSCAGDSGNNEDPLPPPESKTSPGKGRWSFQKRSAMYHIQSNNVNSESMPVMNNKHNQEACFDTETSEKVPVSQKVMVAEQTTETPTLPLAVVPSRESEQVTDKSNIKVDLNIHEDVVVIVQACIRGYMARRELEKINNFVKLQAAMRRYLVRKRAVGTLRCILAIVKIQHIIRTRIAIQSTEFTAKEKLNKEMTAVKAKSFEVNSSKISPAIRSLISNAFASQLLKSTLKTKHIHISCNTLNPNSEWVWLERWSALASSYRQKVILKQDYLEENIKTHLDVYEINNKFQVTLEHTSSDLKLTPSDPFVPAEVEVGLIPNSSEKIELDAPVSIQEHCSDSPIQNEDTTSACVSDSVHSQFLLPSDALSDFELDSNANYPDFSEETRMKCPKNKLHEMSEMEVDHVVTESSKLRNQGFAAVQAKFEDLSVASCSNRSLSHDSMITKSDSISVQPQFGSNSAVVSEEKSVTFQAGTKFKGINLAENFTGHIPVNQILPMKNGIGIFPEIKRLEGKPCNSSTNFSGGDMIAKTDDLLHDSNAACQQKMLKNSEFAARPVKTDQESADSITLNTKDLLVERSSQEGSPRIHITAPEVHSTPSSQISSQTTKGENNIPLRKRRPQLLANSSPVDSKNDSGARSSGDQCLKKDTKSSKRRNSFSMAKTDHIDHERQTNNGNLLPSYMQPTESAKAKVNSNVHQKSCSDLHEKDYHIKKRHSFPNGDGKQGSSPRIQRSTSQVQQNLKGNGIHSPHNSAERRWLR